MIPLQGEKEQLFLEILYNMIQKVVIKQGVVTAVNKDENTCSVLLEDLVYENVPINILNQKGNMVAYPAIETSCNVFFLEAQTNVIQLINFQDTESIVISDNENDFITEIVLGTEEKPIPKINIQVNEININAKNEMNLGTNDTKIPTINISAEKINVNADEINLGSSSAKIPKINISAEKFNISADNTVFNEGSNGGMVISSKISQQLNNSENFENQILSVLKSIVITLAPTGTVPFAPFFAAINPLVPTQPAQIENTKIKQ
jgi:hypothetical protein